MDKNLEKQLRKVSFYVMAGQLEKITKRTYLTVSEVSTLLQCSRPTAKKFMESLIDAGKAKGVRSDKGTLMIVVYFSAWTTKEADRARAAYDNLVFELSA